MQLWYSLPCSLPPALLCSHTLIKRRTHRPPHEIYVQWRTLPAVAALLRCGQACLGAHSATRMAVRCCCRCCTGAATRQQSSTCGPSRSAPTRTREGDARVRLQWPMCAVCEYFADSRVLAHAGRVWLSIRTSQIAWTFGALTMRSSEQQAGFHVAVTLQQ